MPPSAAPAPSAAELDAATRLTARVAFAVLAAAAAVGLWAALELRPLFADGFHYLLRLLELEAPFVPSPARSTVDLLRQLPVLAAVALGVEDVAALAVLFALFVQLVPIALLPLCWAVLPRERKVFFIFPLVHFVVGTLAAFEPAIVEGPGAAAYFWVVLFAVLFRRPKRYGWIGLALLAAWTAVLHEGMVFLGPILAAAAGWRAVRAGRGRARLGWWLLAGWFVAVAAVQLGFVLEPRDPANRAAFLRQLTSLSWMAFRHETNWPAIIGALGLGALGLCAVLERLGARAAWPRSGWIAVGGFALVAAAALVYAAVTGRVTGAQAQFHARNHPLLLSAAVALFAFNALLRPGVLKPALLRQTAIVCAIAAAASLAWHGYGVARWSRYVETVREVLRDDAGLVDWHAVAARLPPERRRLMHDLTHHWVMASMSIILAPGGRVGAILFSRERSITPFDPRDPAALPRARFWRYEPYLAALARQKASGEVR
jgi:hypothetical protein